MQAFGLANDEADCDCRLCDLRTATAELLLRLPTLRFAGYDLLLRAACCDCELLLRPATASIIGVLMDNRKPKRLKNIFSYFQSNVSPSGGKSTYHDVGSGSDVRTRNISEEIVNEKLISPSSISLEDGQNEKIMDEAAFNINSLERDPAKRQAIWKYPLNEQDNVQRAYVVLGANQPHLKAYPSTWDGGQYRKFNTS
ncbi:hypothetical protein QQ045_020611 [Rhodiola kirilowii]